MKAMFLSEQNGPFRTIDEFVDGAWVSLIDPTKAEIEEVSAEFGIEHDHLHAALDIEERSRVTAEEGYVLILVDVLTSELRGGQSWYATIPLAIIIAPRGIVTVCLQKVPVLAAAESGRIRSLATTLKSRFAIQLLLRSAGVYLGALKNIEKMTDDAEINLRRSTRNRELVDMLEIQKSLVYISTSLASNQRVLDRIVRTTIVKKYPEDDDLLQDTIVENEQAIEMANIYSGILSGTMDAYASVISNNQNAIMKTLALVTIVLSIPTMIFSAYGMNVELTGMPFAHSFWGFLIVVGFSFLLAVAAVVIFIRMRWF
ncbi:MAG: magnesium transporter CorA family protein [Propionibacteriaceae bacterium]|nr:magnesium transporter CorA family protein [Propionibacteriaceae bacterium]